MISASHNPFEHNGIKIFDRRGFKLPDELEGEIEKVILEHIPVPLKTHGDLGRVIYAAQKESQDYIDHLVSTIHTDLAGLHILVDCAMGRLPRRPRGCLTPSRICIRMSSMPTRTA